MSMTTYRPYDDRYEEEESDGNWVHLNGSPVGFQVGAVVGSRWRFSFLAGRGELRARSVDIKEGKEVHI